MLKNRALLIVLGIVAIIVAVGGYFLVGPGSGNVSYGDDPSVTQDNSHFGGGY